jgi:hypothetical protein
MTPTGNTGTGRALGMMNYIPGLSQIMRFLRTETHKAQKQNEAWNDPINDDAGGAFESTIRIPMAFQEMQ